MRDDRTDRGAPESRARWLLRRIYTANPFYIISADLVFLGLRMSFDPDARVFDTWALAAGLAAYTLLLATTACLLIRFGKVWDDARTIALLVVLMFLATSVTFDDVLIASPARGAACFVGGLAFAVAVSEAMLRGMRLGLPAGYRLPYDLLLAGFFLYPLGLRPLLGSPESPAAFWALFGFGPTMGLLFLTLLPAIRRGAGYVSGNGSPWRWPLYPWTLFGMLGLAAAARGYSLGVSLHGGDPGLPSGHADGLRSAFGPYFLIPLGLAGCLLLLEAGLVGRRRGLTALALVLPLALAGLGLVGHRGDALYLRSLATFEAGLGGRPAFVGLLAAAGFGAYAAARGARGAWDATSAALAALAVVGPTTLRIDPGLLQSKLAGGPLAADGLVAPQFLPLAAALSIQGWLAARRGETWRAALAAGVGVLGVWAGPLPAPAEPFRAALTVHAAIAGLLVVGAAFADPLARRLRRAGALLMLWAGAAAVTGDPRLFAPLPPELALGYAAGLAAAGLAYGLALREPIFLQAAALGLMGLLAGTGWKGYVELRRAIRGLDQIVLGLASFALAAAVSLAKAGLLRRARDRVVAALARPTDPLGDAIDGP